MKHFSFIFLVAVAIMSCNRDAERYDRLLKSVANIVEFYPDTALLLLDSIANPYLLNERCYALYLLRSVQAKDKTDKNISQDTAIVQAKNYFYKTGEISLSALAGYYAGCIYKVRNEYDLAIQYLLEANEMATQTNDNALKGLILYKMGELNYDYRLFDETITYSKQAIDCFLNTGKHHNAIVAWNIIANCFSLKDTPDSAFFYYSKAFDFAGFRHDTDEQKWVLNNEGVTLREMGKTAKAKACFFKALKLDADSSAHIVIYLNLAKVYETENKLDSAFFYAKYLLNIFRETKNTERLASMNLMLSRLEEKSVNYRNALEYHREYAENLITIMNKTRNFAIVDIQRKFQTEQLQNANKQLIIQQLTITIIAVSITFLLGIVLFLLYRKNKTEQDLTKDKLLQLNKLLNDTASSSEKRENEFKAILLRKLDSQLKLMKLDLFENEFANNREKIKFSSK
ncbi:MAG: hypothetical protein LBD45_03755, partial [Bacteroidales bacterium]|nr:hypothetical protein [Bacteroidales bacterium]